MEYLEELENKFNDTQRDLARIDFDHQYTEQKLLQSEKGSLEYFHFYEILSALKTKRAMVVSRLVDLRKQIEKEKNGHKKGGAIEEK